MLKLKVTFILFMLCISMKAYAWKFNEHRELGELSFKKACLLLESKYTDETNLERISMFKSILCSNINEQARQYGMRSALAADHISSPKDFESTKAERQALSWLNYGALALKNHEHFWPHVKKSWRRYHKESIDSAIKAREYWNNNRKIKAVVEFERALILSSFADHFLQDSFSIGHGGFSRINSLQNPSLIFHDEWNNKGRWMKGSQYHLSHNFNVGDSDVYKQTAFSCENNIDKSYDLIIKNVDLDSNFNKWFAYGDGKLHCNPGNFTRIIDANVNSIVSVFLSFMDGNDSDYSMKADHQFPISTQSFSQKSVYANYINGATKGRYTTSNPITEVCSSKGKEVYELNDVCWFDLENSFMEPVYSDLTLAISRVTIQKYSESVFGLYLAYSFYSPNLPLLELWPKNIRAYFFVNVENLDINYKGHDVTEYRELGLNFILPNFYDGTPISHEIDVAYALIGSSQENWYDSIKKRDDGAYLGVNTNLDIMKLKLTLGLGWFIPSTDLSDALFKWQVMLGWNFGVLGGGPLTRWKD